MNSIYKAKKGVYYGVTILVNDLCITEGNYIKYIIRNNFEIVGKSIKLRNGKRFNEIKYLFNIFEFDNEKKEIKKLDSRIFYKIRKEYKEGNTELYNVFHDDINMLKYFDKVDLIEFDNLIDEYKELNMFR